MRPDDILQQSLQQGRGGLLQRASCIGFRPKSENQKMRFFATFLPILRLSPLFLKSGQKKGARRFTPDETVDISLCSDDSHFVSACPLLLCQKWAVRAKSGQIPRRILSHIVAYCRKRDLSETAKLGDFVRRFTVGYRLKYPSRGHKSEKWSRNSCS